MKTLTATIVALLTGLLALSGVMSAPVALPAKPPTVISTGLPPCASEDSTYNCIWDAQRRGNRQGTSFIVYNGSWYYRG